MVNEAADFQCIMNLILGESTMDDKQHKDALSICGNLEKSVSDACKEHDFDIKDLDDKAGAMVEKNRGDILPALNYLSRFTYDNDPQVRPEGKKDYLVGVLALTKTARSYFDQKRKAYDFMKAEEAKSRNPQKTP